MSSTPGEDPEVFRSGVNRLSTLRWEPGAYDHRAGDSVQRRGLVQGSVLVGKTAVGPGGRGCRNDGRWGGKRGTLQTGRDVRWSDAGGGLCTVHGIRLGRIGFADRVRLVRIRLVGRVWGLIRDGIVRGAYGRSLAQPRTLYRAATNIVYHEHRIYRPGIKVHGGCHPWVTPR